MITFASYLKDILNLNYLYFFKYKYLPSQDGFLWDYYVFVMNFILFLKGHRYLIRVVRSYFLDTYLTICILNHMHEISVQFSSITQLCPTLCDPMVCSTPGLCPWPTPEVYPNSCTLSWWCHPTISYSVVPFSSCLQSFPASESFPMSKLFASGGKSIGV